MKRGKEFLVFAIFIFSIILATGLVSAINTCDTGYQVVKGGSATIKCYDSCGLGRVTYSGSQTAIFVPTKTQAEWNAFKAVYSTLSITYTCGCTPSYYCPGGSQLCMNSCSGYLVNQIYLKSDCSTTTTSQMCCMGTCVSGPGY